MLTLKNSNQHQRSQEKQTSSIITFQTSLRLFIFILLLQFVSLFSFGQEGALVWAAGFETSPQVIDDADEDTTFSPNGDGVQDKLLIGFVTDGSLGDFRITIDVHGAGAIGAPDGKFDVNDDWVVKGFIGSGITVNDAPRIIGQEWDGKDRSSDQQTPPAARALADGTYQIKVEIDAFQNGTVGVGELGYTTATRSATIDAKSPQLSVEAVSQPYFSPNADGFKDTTIITYRLGEDLAELLLEFTNAQNQPTISLADLTADKHIFIWDGKDGLGTSLVDGTHSPQLRGKDKGGNVGTFGFGDIQIDTEPPSISQVTPSDNASQNTPISAIEATLSPNGGTSIDFTPTLTKITLKDANDASISGSLSSDDNTNRLTLTLDEPLDAVDENGVYTITVDSRDKGGNRVQGVTRFTLDTSPPVVTKLTADGQELKPGAGIKAQLAFVEATLEDNLGLNLSASTIRLSSPQGEVSGVQSLVGGNGIRWTLGFPLATDGSDDERYTITVAPVDKAGNANSQRQLSFVYDTQVPQLTSLSPIDISVAQTFQNSALSEVTAVFDDGSGSGVDFGGATIEMTRRSDGEDGVTVVGTLIPDTDNNTLAFRLNQPLEIRDGSQDGIYGIQVSFMDKAGNGQTVNFDLVYDTQVPLLVSTTPVLDSTVSSLSQVSVRLNDVTSGVNFSLTTVRLLLGGSEVNADASNNGQDTIKLTLAKPLTTDGSDDGEYTVEITPVDRASNAGATIRRQFFFATRAPEIRLNVPTETRINALTTIEAELLDYIGPGIDFSSSKSTIEVKTPNGEIVTSKEVTNDEATRLIWTIDTALSRNGSSDGQYTVGVSYEDFVGTTFTKDFPLTFDTQIPTIESTTPTAGGRVSQLNQIMVKFRGDLSGVDLAGTQIRLLQPDGTQIGSNREDNGVDTIILRFNPLRGDGTTDGLYAIEVTPADRAGNIAESPFQVEFTYATQIPEIDTLTPADNAIVSRVQEIVAVLIDNSGEGFDFAQSTITLKNTDGVEIDGKLGDDGNLTLTLAVILPTNGTSDGVYTVNLHLVDKLGTIADYTRRFTYDSQPPMITLESRPPAESATIRDRIEIEFEVIDPPPRVEAGNGEGSGVNFAASDVQLIAPDNTPVASEKIDDGVKRIAFESAMLPSVGTYTLVVTLMDVAGNRGIPQEFTIIYDMEEPVIEAVNVITPSSVIPLDITANVSNISNLLTRVETILSDDSAEIDFVRSSIQLLNAAGEVVPGVLNDDDTAKMWWLLNLPLSRDGDADGLYSIRVQAFDKAGNLEGRTFGLRYDTQAPIVSSIRALQVDGTPVDILTEGTGDTLSLITTPINQFAIIFSDGEGSGINVLTTTVSLVAPNGAPVSTNQTDDGGNTVFLAFNPLRGDGSDDGRYRIQITPTDLAGNTFTSPLEFPFFYGTRKPEVVSTTPDAFSFATQLTAVSATLLDHSGEGIDFDRSTIRLRGPDGSDIAGRQRVDEVASTITWELNAPPSRDGAADGEYTIQLTVLDKAGSRLDADRAFVYDTQIPKIVSVIADTTPPTPIPAERLQVLNQSLTELSIKFSDVNARAEKVSGVNLVGTDVRLVAPGDIQVGINTRDDGVDTIAVSFASLRQPGTYSLDVTPRDLAGNLSGHAIPYRFSIELGRPRVSAVTIGERAAPVEFVNRLDSISATLVDVSSAGLDLTTDGSKITVIGPNGEVEGIQSAGETNQIVWTPLQLATDGTADGIYTVTVAPIDSAGRSGTPSVYQFTFDTQPPDVVAVTPIDLTQPVSYIGQQITQITAQVIDVGPADLVIEAQRLQLQDAQGNIVAADLTDDGNNRIFLTLSQPLATDGSDDGSYTVVLDLTDRAGNLNAVAHRVVYDTRAPILFRTDPTDGALVSDDIRLITADLQEVGDSGIDFGASTLTLLDANGASITGQPNNDGQGRMTLQIQGLAADGNYTISVQAVDRAGNGTDAPFTRGFVFSTGMPAVVSTVPVTAPSEQAFTNQPLSQVEAQLQLDGSGPNRSTITLLASDGTTVAGQQSREGSKLIYRLSRQLAADGSDDGLYTIAVTPVNRAGRQGTPQQFTFFYDTVPPEVDPETISLVVAEPGVNNALNEIQALVTDDEPSAGIDWENLAESWLTLEKIDVGQKIRGTLSSDEQQTVTFRLATPLASDGSQDGKYRVTVIPMDRAKNAPKAVTYEFFYDTRPPLIALDSLQLNGQSLLADINHPDYPSATNNVSGVTIHATIDDVNPDGSRGLGVDLSKSTITVRSPDGSPISGSSRQNGTNGLEFKSGPLTAEGLYQVTITSVGLDEANLGFQPTDSSSTQFLYEKTDAVAELTDFGGVTTLEDEVLPLRGTAHDPATEGVAASGVVLVEIVGIGPDGTPIDPVAAEDESEAEEEPWSRWTLDFLPARSGEYNLDIQVTDRAGNIAVYDAVTVNFSVSLAFKGPTYVWPNPVRQLGGDLAHFSFDVNVPGSQGATVTLRIYDFAGDLVYEKDFPNLSTGRDNDQLVTWNLENQSGASVARGVYIFRLEAEHPDTKTRTNAVGKILVVE